MIEHGTETWGSPAWRDRATAWLDAQLAASGVARTGPVEQPHLRPWATALRAPTTRGAVWLKAAAPGTAFEVELYALLHRFAPGRVLTPLAADRERAWIVLPDGGTPIGERFDGDALVEAFATFLPDYAQLQRDLAPHAGDLVAIGLADMRPAVLPDRFEEALDVVRPHADAESFGRLVGLRAAVAGWCEELRAAPGAPTVDHNDLHPRNVLLGEDGATRPFDWGDAVVAHPFASLLVPLRWVREQAPDAAERVRDAYLAGFADLAPHAELVRTQELACRLALIARTLIWHRAIGDDPHWATAPFETLSELLR